MNDYFAQKNKPKTTQVIDEILALAKELGTPIIQEDAIHFMIQLIKIAKAKRVLEIGTAIGYSAIMIASFTPATVLTLERDSQSVALAKEHIKKANLDSRIQVIETDANEYTPTEEEPFDLLFIDAAKASYERFFERFSPFVKPGGIIVADNLLFHGLVEHPEDAHTKGTKSLVRKIDDFNDYLTSKDGFDTYLYAIGDGLSISIKKE